MIRDQFNPRQIRMDSNNRVAASLREKQKKENYVRRDPYDSSIYEKGVAFGRTGKLLSEANSDLVKNTNFVNGYNNGKILIDVYNAGKNFALSRQSYVNASLEFQRNLAFYDGYLDVIRQLFKETLNNDVHNGDFTLGLQLAYDEKNLACFSQDDLNNKDLMNGYLSGMKKLASKNAGIYYALNGFSFNDLLLEQMQDEFFVKGYLDGISQLYETAKNYKAPVAKKNKTSR